VKKIRAVDLFCGAGGSSTGLQRACDDLGVRLELTAVNHWETAIETHARNHPQAVHWCEPIDAINPRRAVPSGKLDLLWASPECTHHSVARGGRPMNDQSRASAWCVLRWATALDIKTILVENVREFLDWGPLGSNSRPLKSRKGETFAAFVQALQSLGYHVAWKVLNAADYGDPTTRHRLYMQARKGRRPLVWPDATHTEDGAAELFGAKLRWRSARGVIDWSKPGRSIFGRSRPLSPNTLTRIAAGLRKFGDEKAGPFLAMLYGSSDARSLDRPLPTVTAGCPGHMALVKPFLVPANHGEREGQAPRCRGIDKPLPTVTGSLSYGVVEPFIMGMSQTGSSGDRMRPSGDPLPTVTTADDLAVVEPFIVKHNRTGRPCSLDEPLDTITGNDRLALVQAAGLDIRFRMLLPRELARGQGFPDEYEFVGTREDVVKQIGNAVPIEQARAINRAVIATEVA
jgi:DNA (cytosine-5)-methyltransferase 1